MCASGSHVCRGKSGTLIANARKNAPKSKYSVRRRQRDRAIGKQRLNLRDVKRWIAGDGGDPVEPQNRHEHQDRAEHRIQHELQRGINAAAVSPDADQEIHRDQHHFPEQKEQEQIERNENADHSGLKDQKANKEAFYALVDRFPRCQDRNRRKQRGQQNEKQAESVNAQVIVDRGLRNPGAEFFPLIAGGVRVKSTKEQQRKSEFDDRRGHGQPANPEMVVIAQQQKRKRSRDGQKRQNRKQVSLLHVSPPSRAAGK